MAATSQELNKEVLENGTLAVLKTVLSTFLQGKVSGFGTEMFSRKEIGQYVLDLDLTSLTTLLDSDLKGLGYFFRLRTLILPTLATPLTAGSIDISGFDFIETLKSLQSGSSPFRGDYSVFTKLKTFYVVLNGAALSNASSPVVFSNNPDLETVYISTSSSLTWGAANIGNLSGNTKMKTYQLNGATSLPASVIDNILSTLRTAKVAGAPLTAINMAGSKAPTGGAANADAVWLAANGVTVTLGTA